MDLTSFPIIDHHAHPLLKPEATADPVGFRQWFTESTDPTIHAEHVPNSLFFRTGLRWLAELLDCEPTLDDYLAARASQPYDDWCRRLFTEANISLLLCDYGYTGPLAYAHSEMQGLLPCRVEPILRLEVLAQDLIVRHETFEDMREDFVATVGRARSEGYVALKSIIAYRSGLVVEAAPPEEAAAAFAPLKEVARRTGQVRLASKPLGDYLLGLAVEQAAAQNLPLQIHTGFGDRDADLRWANPLHLRALIERANCPLVLLHAGWPYYRELAHLAAIYPNVWLDLSLAIPFATTGIPAMLRDILGMAPLSKVMFATDAFTMPEIFWLAARWGRWGLGRILDEFIAEQFLSPAEAESAAAAILSGTAQRLYMV
ncbi:MAG TPA: amidohydrolase family protein [Anaerolineae bacterium]|nr:amidohydrolase family protein [Anaerolineae bacterium]